MTVVLVAFDLGFVFGCQFAESAMVFTSSSTIFSLLYILIWRYSELRDIESL